MKKIAIFGITGKTGRRIFELIYNNDNYDVNALIRNSKPLPDSKNIKFIIGDILDQAVVDEVVKDCECVISVIGHTKNSNPDVQSIATENIINSMNKFKIKRFISLTGTGVRISNDKISLIDKIANFIIKKIDKKRIYDGLNHYNILKKSNLDWTILRVLKLTNYNKVEKYALNDNGPAKTFISRKTIAKIILDLIDDDSFIRKLPIVTD